jgi:DNA-binding beta-propeller fold protein YncE
VRARARHLRILALLALAPASALALAPAPALARPASATHQVLFVANSDVGTVTLIDARALTTMGTLNVIPDGDTPRDPAQAALYPAITARQGKNFAQGIAISPEGQTLYVSRGYLGDVAAFDLATGKLLWRLQTTSLRADHVALSPDGRRLFVSALTSNQVQVVDTASHAFVGSFPTGDWPHVLGFSPDGRYVYNGSLGDQLAPKGLDGAKQITVADPTTLQVVRTYSFQAGVRPFAITPGGDTMFVQLSYLNGFAELDLPSGRIVTIVNLPVSGPGAAMRPQDYPNQAAHHGIDLSRDGRYVCDAGTISDYVALVSRPTLTPAAIIPVGDQPAEAQTSLDGRYCFVTDRGPASNAVSVISYADRREVARIPVGRHPQEEQEATIPDTVLRAGGFLGPASGSGSTSRPRRRPRLKLTRVRVTRRVFRVGRPGDRRPARGTAFLFSLSRPAQVTIVLTRMPAGAGDGRRRTRVRGALTVAGHAGHNSLPFSGRLDGRRLRPGRYRARLRATSRDGQRVRPVIVRFTVVA